MRLVHRRLIGGSVGLLAGLLLAVPAQAETTVTFNFTGAEQVFKVPTGVSSVHVEAIGAAGASVGTVPGGLGGFAAADVTVIPGQVLYVEVGGIGGSPTVTTAGASLNSLKGDGPTETRTAGPGGFNGGGAGGPSAGPLSYPGAGGGGGSDVRTVSRAVGATLSSRLVIAGGGGGAGAGDNGSTSTGGAGGAAGASGSSGNDTTSHGGGGAVSNSPGAGGTATSPMQNGAAGNFGLGGIGGTNGPGGAGQGGGGGGGFLGGGGGAAGSNGMSGGAGGGGGSSAFGVGVTGIFTGLETRAASISISYTAVPTAKKCKKKKHRSASSAKKKKCKKKR